MKKLLFLFAIFTFCFAFSQNSNSKNIVLGEKRSKAFILGDKTYKWSEYQQVFKKPEALELMKKARTNTTVGQIFATTGGFSIGWGLGMLISKSSNSTVSKGKPTPFFLVGAGLVGIGIPFALTSDKQLKKAVSIENGESTAFQPYFKFETTGNGIALSYNF